MHRILIEEMRLGIDRCRGDERINGARFGNCLSKGSGTGCAVCNVALDSVNTVPCCQFVEHRTVAPYGRNLPARIRKLACQGFANAARRSRDRYMPGHVRSAFRVGRNSPSALRVIRSGNSLCLRAGASISFHVAKATRYERGRQIAKTSSQFSNG